MQISKEEQEKIGKLYSVTNAKKKKKIEENNRMGKTEISARKLEILREHFMQRWAQLRTERVEI